MLNHNCGDKVDWQHWLRTFSAGRCCRKPPSSSCLCFRGGLQRVRACVCVRVSVCVIVNVFDVMLWQHGSDAGAHCC